MNKLRGSARFHQILKELGELHDKKQADYGRPEDPFANVRASEGFGIPGWIGCMMRANDKMVRIQKAAQGGKLANEALEDSLRDLAVYAVIGLCLFEESQEPKAGAWEELARKYGTASLGSAMDGLIVIDGDLDHEVDEAFDRITSGGTNPDVVIGTLTR